MRTKWTVVKNNFEAGDLVLMKDKNTSPLHWPLGRIKKVYKANDGLVRVVDVLSNGKIYKRPVGKLSLLPVRDDDEFKTDSNEETNMCDEPKNKLERNM